MEQQVQQFAQEGKWLGVLLVLVLYTTRLFKPDTKLPWNINPRWIPFFAIGIGVIGGTTEKLLADVTRGVPLTKETVLAGALNGLATGVSAFLLHHLTFNGLFPKSDLPLPDKLLIPGVSPAPGKPPSLPPEDMSEEEKKKIPNGNLVFLILFSGSLLFGMQSDACTPQGRTVAGDLAASKVSCVLANLGEPWQRVVEKCAFEQGDVSKYERIFSDGQRVMSAAREDERRRLSSSNCAPDGGAK